MGDRLEVIEVEGGVRFPVKVSPRASRTAAAGILAGALKVRVAAPPVEGAANRELTAYLAKRCGVPRSAVTIDSGEGSKRKMVRITGIDPDTLRSLLA